MRASLPWLAIWRWHRASIVMAFLAVSVTLVLNSVPYGAVYGGMDDFYGWPREFISGYPHGAYGVSVFSLIPGTVLEFDAVCLAFNVVVAAATAGGVGMAFEYRYRRWQKKVWQFSVNDLLIAALVVAGTLCWVVRQNVREEVALNRLHCHFAAGSILPDGVRRYLPNMPSGWLKPFDRVASLHIMGGARESDYFAALDQFPEVKKLAIEADFGDGTLIHIARMRGLRYLSLESPRLTGENLQALCALSSLRDLRVRSAHLSEEGLRQLSRLAGVDIHLDMRGAAITETPLRELADISGLVGLTLGECSLDDKALSALSQVTQLKYLTLDSAKQRTELLIRLARLRRLSVLRLPHLPQSNYRVLDDLRKNLPGCAIFVN